MEVKVGIQNIGREVVVDTTASAASVEQALTEALKADGVFTLTDDKGRKVLVPAAGIAYVDLGAEHARVVGFGAV